MKGISLEKEKTWRDKKKRKRKKEEEKQPTASFLHWVIVSIREKQVRDKSDTPNFFFLKAWQPPFMENQTQNSGGK